MRFALLVSFAAGLLACHRPTAPAPSTAPADASAATLAPRPDEAPALVRQRPFAMHVPDAARRGAPAPVVVFLHGYGASGSEARGLGLEALADEQGFVLVSPDGTRDSRGRRFWNATDACCDFDRTGVDDVAYLTAVLDAVAARTPVDRARVYAMGHSNGGFMAHRLACDRSARLAAVVSLAGALWNDAERCAPERPVSVLEVHGDADEIIRMGGGRVFGLPVAAYPSVERTVRVWAARDRCTGALHALGPPLDFDESVPGPETTRETFAPCASGSDVELWRVAGGSHVPRPTHDALEAVWAWLQAHPKKG